MSIFNGTRLTNQTFKLDVDRMRRGWYSDKYFANVGHMLESLSKSGYAFKASSPRLPQAQVTGIGVGDIEVEVQWFPRRNPTTLVAGVDKALSMLSHCTGIENESGEFESTWDQLDVQAVEDGVFAPYHGDPMDVSPVLRVRGKYRHFAMLETPTLGILSRASRIATNVYNTLVAARGKPILFFPARFDVHEVQAADGYAYDIAVRRYNLDFHGKLESYVSTDAQGDWWGGFGGGTIPHAVIACFLGNTTEALMSFADTQPAGVPRIALVDFNNDSVGTSLDAAHALFDRYRAAKDSGNDVDAERFRLFGVRLDTSSNIRDTSLVPLGDSKLDLGVNPRLVTAVRDALNSAWERWDVPQVWRSEARAFCSSVKIVVSGGFTPDKIALFEKLRVPVDIYGVGSSLMANDESTNTDFTADVVAVKLNDEWVPMAKIGRQSCANPNLRQIDVDHAERLDPLEAVSQ